MDLSLKLITPKIPQPIIISPQTLEILDRKGLYEFLAHI